MAPESQNEVSSKPAWLPRVLWGGVLPEALGLCFVAIIFGGFAAAYFIGEHSWKARVREARQAETETLARTMAASLGTLTDADDEVTEQAIETLVGCLPRARVIQWTLPGGKVRRAGAPAVPGTAPPEGVTAATVPVRTPAGEEAGTLLVERDAMSGAHDPSFLLWSWSVAAGVTLGMFAIFYRRLRRHLRPAEALGQSLQGYADGLVTELTTLTLSDSLGPTARGWNRLIEQLVQLQREVQYTQAGGTGPNVLARFEGAVFRRLVDRLPYGVLLVAENQTIRYSNLSAAALLGRPLAEIMDRPAHEAVSNPAIVQALAGAHARPGGLVVDHSSRDGEHESTLRFRVVPLADQSGAGEALITVEDISQLREGQRARDNFLYHVTHELRTPLTNIHAYTETLTKPGFDDEQTRKECYNVIISETRRLSSLVENILSISQLEVGTARLETCEVDLLRLIRQMVQDNLGAADEKHIDLTLSLPPKVPKISGDKQRLSVLLNNLIGNAIKYTPENGKVQVKLEVDELQVRIAVSDTGIGIAPEDQKHVFEKFYRANNDAVQMITGTGLGLSLAREVAHLHGGEIQLTSALGKGSTFTVELPMPHSSHAEVSGS